METVWRTLLERRRHTFYRDSYLVAMAIVIGLLLVPSLVLVALGAAMTPDQSLLLAAVAGTSFLLGNLAGPVTARRDARLLTTYLRGGEVPPEQVWAACAQLPGRQVTPNSVVVFSLWLAASVVLGPTRIGLSLLTVLLLILVATLLGWGLTVIGMRSIYHPVMAEVSGSDPARIAALVSQRGVGRDVSLGAMGVTVLGALVGGAAGVQFTDPDQRLLAMLLAGLVAAAWSGYVFRTLVAQPLLAPLAELADHARRVGAGDLTGTAPMRTDDEFGQLGAAFNEMTLGLRERERLHAAFGSYVDPALAQRLLEQPDSLFAGEEVDVTVMFADVRNFTSYAETASPTAAVARLNALFGVLVPILLVHGGHANKYLGDGVLAVFGAPEPLDDHADRAVEAAGRIQAAVRERFGEDLRIGIGLNTGRAIAGTIGGGGKLEFTLIGDVVNVAARVEELTKATGDQTLVTQATVDALRPGRSRFESRGEHPLRGKAEPVAVHAHVGERQ